MRCRGVSGTPDVADDLSLADPLAARQTGGVAAEVRVVVERSVVGVDVDLTTAGVVPAEPDLAVVHRHQRCSPGRCHVDALVGSSAGARRSPGVDEPGVAGDRAHHSRGGARREPSCASEPNRWIPNRSYSIPSSSRWNRNYLTRSRNYCCSIPSSRCWSTRPNSRPLSVRPPPPVVAPLLRVGVGLLLRPWRRSSSLYRAVHIRVVGFGVRQHILSVFSRSHRAVPPGLPVAPGGRPPRPASGPAPPSTGRFRG